MENQTQTRPTFLTVLCVLTFIGSGFGLLGGIFSYVTAPMSSAMTTEVMAGMENQLAEEEMNETVANMMESIFSSSIELMEYAAPLAIVSIIGALLSITGAVFMYRMQKKGFYLYTVAQLAMVFAPCMFVGFNFMTGMSMMGTGFFALIFIVMYGVNVKHLS